MKGLGRIKNNREKEKDRELGASGGQEERKKSSRKTYGGGSERSRGFRALAAEG